MRQLILIPIAAMLMGTTFYQYNIDNNPYNFTDTKKNIPVAAVNVVERDTEELDDSRFTGVVQQPEFHEHEVVEEVEIPPVDLPHYVVRKERRQFGAYSKVVIVIYRDGKEIAVSDVDEVLNVNVK